MEEYKIAKRIEELKIEGAELIETGKLSNRSKTKQVIKFNEYLDDTNVTEFKLIPTYKRMCICIMKNGFILTKWYVNNKMSNESDNIEGFYIN